MFLSGTDRSRAARASGFAHQFYEANRAQGYGACDRLPLSAACVTDTELSGSNEFTERALHAAALEEGLAGNYLLEACTPGKYIADDRHLEHCHLRSIPIWCEIGLASHNYVFEPMDLDYMHVLKGNRRVANNYAAGGNFPFLFKVAVFGNYNDGVWLCAHGPKHINSFAEFQTAQDERSLTPLWGSLDNVIEEGLHYWYTFDSNTWQWVHGCKRYQTTLPDFSDSSDAD